jgi:hypothetical protein
MRMFACTEHGNMGCKPVHVRLWTLEQPHAPICESRILDLIEVRGTTELTTREKSPGKN